MCRIGRHNECKLDGCALKRAGATDCKYFVETSILPKPIVVKKKKVIKRDYKCFYCHKPLKEKQVTKDHIIAKSLGGTSHGKNLVDSCKMCNLFKSNMTLDNFKIKLELILTNVNKITDERNNG